MRTFRIALIALPAIWLLAGTASPARAHLFAGDADVKAVVHVDPDHRPVVGRPASIFFFLQSRRGPFRPGDYRGRIAIKNGGRVVDEFPALGPGSGTAVGVKDYVFTEAGDYTITLTARPGKPGAHPFKISFRQPVIAAGGPSAGGGGWALRALAGSLVICLSVGLADLGWRRLKGAVLRKDEKK